jgi:hypothetical protein
MIKASVFLLPEYRLGPYTMAARPFEAPLEAKGSRTHARFDFSTGVILVNQLLPPGRQLAVYVHAMVQAIQYRSGLHYDFCDEEAHTQNLATSLAELAGQPLFWGEFNTLLAQELYPRAKWGAAAARLPSSQPVSAPSRIVCRADVCSFTRMAPADIRADAAWALYNFERKHRTIELHPDLTGRHAAVVIMHEVIHFLHDSWKIRKTRAKAKEFSRTESLALLEFWRHNPKFWTWWLQQAARLD